MPFSLPLKLKSLRPFRQVQADDGDANGNALHFVSIILKKIKMKTLDKIPTNKIERAGQLVKTGFKVGGNYIAYYGEKIVNPTLTRDIDKSSDHENRPKTHGAPKESLQNP